MRKILEFYQTLAYFHRGTDAVVLQIFCRMLTLEGFKHRQEVQLLNLSWKHIRLTVCTHRKSYTNKQIHYTLYTDDENTDDEKNIYILLSHCIKKSQ